MLSFAHLRRTWCSSAAKEVKREANASTRPPITAVSLVLPRRHAPTTKGADPRETAALKAPTHAETLIHSVSLSQTRQLILSFHVFSLRLGYLPLGEHVHVLPTPLRFFFFSFQFRKVTFQINIVKVKLVRTSPVRFKFSIVLYLKLLFNF